MNLKRYERVICLIVITIVFCLTALTISYCINQIGETISYIQCDYKLNGEYHIEIRCK